MGPSIEILRRCGHVFDWLGITLNLGISFWACYLFSVEILGFLRLCVSRGNGITLTFRLNLYSGLDKGALKITIFYLRFW